MNKFFFNEAFDKVLEFMVSRIQRTTWVFPHVLVCGKNVHYLMTPEETHGVCHGCASWRRRSCFNQVLLLDLAVTSL